MKLVTYQSELVLNIIKRKEVYRAKPSISFKREYQGLIDMLKLDCACPIFAVVKGRKQNTSGRISGSVRFILDVPDDQVRLTEFSQWADFMYGVKFTKGTGYSRIKEAVSCPEITQEKHNENMKKIMTERPLKDYKFPQAILEKIDPSWVVSYKKMKNSSNSIINFEERFLNFFRK